MMNQDYKNIDEYIASFPNEVQERLQKLRATIRKAAPDAEEAIKYGIPTYVWKRNLIHFAAYKNHIGLYPGPKAIANFKDELSKYKLSKGTVQFPLDKPIPSGLITKITKFNLKAIRDRL
jgi:uncharacterized protein YdhG (YjbR/CyaY superfamily)